MPPTGFHGLTGILFCRFTRSPSMKLGLVFGSVIPDIDLFGSALIFLLTSSEELAIIFHRSLTHSFFTIVTILLVGLLLEYLSIAPVIDDGQLKLSLLLVGMSIGIFIHVFLDFFYLDGLSILAPLNWDRIYVINLRFDDFSYSSQKKLAAADFQFESLFWLVLYYIAGKDDTDSYTQDLLGIRKITISNIRNKVLWLSII
ncbi:MAG: metal-dependent hydrolase, partial [Candidatus Hodarchaeales archaeon]